MRHDIVIGSDAAGCTAAAEAARHGQDVLLVDDGYLSAEGHLRRYSLAVHQLREAILGSVDARRMFGEEPDAPRLADVRMGSLSWRARELAEVESAGLRSWLISSGVCIDSGPATLLPSGRIRLGTRCVREADIVIIACGSRPRRPTRFPFDDRVICDEWSILQLDELPRSVLIVGAEETGCEFACSLAALGAEVTLLDRRRRMLRYVDRDIVAVLHKKMQRAGIVVVLDEQLRILDAKDHCPEPHAIIRLESGRVEQFERLLTAAGRSPNVETLGLEVELASNCPLTTYSIPEISMVGFTAETCDRLDVPHVVGVARYEELSLGRIREDRDGMLKLVVGRLDRRVLGVHLISTSARELVQLGAFALRSQAEVDALGNCVYARPSLSEAYRVAALECLAQLE